MFTRQTEADYVLTLDEIKQRLSDRNLAEVARRTGLSEFTVGRYARGQVRQPPVQTVRILTDYLTEGKR